MRRFLVALSIVAGMAFGVAPAPPTTSQAGQPVKYATKADPPSTTTATIDKASNTFTAPDSVITLPINPPRRGRLVTFGVAPIQNAPKELVKYTYVWDVNPDPGGIILNDDGTKGGFGSGERGDPSEYKLTLISNFAFVDDDNKLTMKSTKTVAYVTIDDSGPKPPDPVIPIPPGPGPVPPGPGPNPGPGPGPGPSPVIPDGKYGLAKFVNALVKEMPKEECTALASEYRRLAGRIAQGAATPNDGIRSKAQLVYESVLGMQNVLKTRYNDWSKILQAVTKQMDSLNIVSLTDCQEAYNELATGLEAR